MGYYSELRVAMTKRDYLTIIEKNEESNIRCDYIINPKEAIIKEYKENGVECILLQQFSLKYYEEFEDVQQFEKYLKETKSGYVFLRIGGRWDDIDYRNTAKFKELEIPFKFIDNIEKKVSKEILNELKSENKHYKITDKQYVFTDKKDILEYYQKDNKLKQLIEQKYNENNQFKLVLHIDTIRKEALGTLYMRDPKADKYQEMNREYIEIDSAISYLGYPNQESFIRDINKNEEDEEFE